MMQLDWQEVVLYSIIAISIASASTAWAFNSNGGAALRERLEKLEARVVQLEAARP